MNEAELEKLTVKELQQLRTTVEEAIRAAIRSKRVMSGIAPAPAPPPPMDLERERDAWLSAKRTAFK